MVFTKAEEKGRVRGQLRLKKRKVLGMKKALSTGVTGQDGSYLAKLLHGKGHDLTGASRRNSQIETVWLQKLGIADDIRPADFDLVDPTKARTRLHWEPKVGIREPAEMTARSDHGDSSLKSS